MLVEDINIEELIPQSMPFIMIDKVTDFKKGESLTAIKNVTANEWFFKGRTSHADFFPETLLIEMASQTALLLYQLSMINEGEEKPTYILGKCKAEFSNRVIIGDQMSITAYADKMMDTGGFSTILINNIQSKQLCIKIIIYYKVIRRK